MWILCLAEDSHEISSLIFSEKVFINVVCYSRDWSFKGIIVLPFMLSTVALLLMLAPLALI